MFRGTRPEKGLRHHTYTFCQGDLLIIPKRVLFEDNKQTEEITLVNIGIDTTIYSISFIEYKMKEEKRGRE